MIENIYIYNHFTTIRTIFLPDGFTFLRVIFNILIKYALLLSSHFLDKKKHQTSRSEGIKQLKFDFEFKLIEI